MMNHLEDLSRDEMLTIEGGDWLVEFGAWCHERWCDLKEAASNALERWSESVDAAGGPAGYSPLR
jgi:hypothetical protein